MPGHEGLDIKAAADSKIFAVLAGKVTYVQHDPTKSNYGKHLWIDHQDGRNTHYAHLNRIDVSVGQMVTAGQVLGLAGSTGNSSGPHLHIDLTHPGKTYTDAAGQVWPFNRFNPWWELDHLYKPDGRTILEGWVYDPYLTKGSDGQAVNYSTNLSLRSGPGSDHPKIGTVPYGTLHELLGDVESSYRPVLTWAVAENPPTPLPTGVDMLPYVKGDGRLFEVRNEWGSQQRHQSQTGTGNKFYQTKNSDWEEMYFTDAHIIRDIDTSPGGGRYYRLKEGGAWGSAWIPRKWSVGDTFTRSRFVQFFKEAGCVPDATNSGNVTDTMRFVAKRGSYTFQTGITLQDVIELEWVNGPERYFYARGYGLVGWKRLHDDPNTPEWSAISEEHAPGERPDNLRKVIGCL